MGFRVVYTVLKSDVILSRVQKFCPILGFDGLTTELRWICVGIGMMAN